MFLNGGRMRYQNGFAVLIAIAVFSAHALCLTENIDAQRPRFADPFLTQQPGGTGVGVPGAIGYVCPPDRNGSNAGATTRLGGGVVVILGGELKTGGNCNTGSPITAGPCKICGCP